MLYARNAIKLEVLEKFGKFALYKATQDGKVWYETKDDGGLIMSFPFLVNAMEYFTEMVDKSELPTGAL